MINWRELEQAWVVERHTRGAVDVKQVGEAVARNYRAMLKGEKEGWIFLAIRPTYGLALEYAQVMRRRIAEYRRTHPSEEGRAVEITPCTVE